MTYLWRLYYCSLVVLFSLTSKISFDKSQDKETKLAEPITEDGKKQVKSSPPTIKSVTTELITMKYYY